MLFKQYIYSLIKQNLSTANFNLKMFWTVLFKNCEYPKS